MIFCIFINTVVNAKYLIENQFEIANLNIDRTKPKIELISINNTNKGYEIYANKTHTITIKVKIIEKNIQNIYFDKEHIKIKLDNNIINIDSMKLTKLEDIQDGKIYQIQLDNINGNGKLKINILEGTVVDKGELKNEEQEIDTKITIDNIAPKGTFSETKISNGKVKGNVKLSETIRKIDGWNFLQDNLKIEKEFTNNISYELPITDYAGNTTVVKISITQATYINITYASHNSEVGWTYGYGNYDIAGANAVKRSSKLKTEAIAIHVEGNTEADFLQANTYVYTYWGSGSEAKDTSTGTIYRYGYNPYEGKYKTMKDSYLITLQEQKYFQFGGAGINKYQNTDINGKNPIPMDKANNHNYGVCGLKIKLKDYSQFSIIYQILVDGVGWIAAKSDDQECMYNKTKPMSAFRIALVPKSEKNYVLNTWNKDIGTFNLK